MKMKWIFILPLIIGVLVAIIAHPYIEMERQYGNWPEKRVYISYVALWQPAGFAERVEREHGGIWLDLVIINLSRWRYECYTHKPSLGYYHTDYFPIEAKKFFFFLDK